MQIYHHHYRVCSFSLTGCGDCVKQNRYRTQATWVRKVTRRPSSVLTTAPAQRGPTVGSRQVRSNGVTCQKVQGLTSLQNSTTRLSQRHRRQQVAISAVIGFFASMCFNKFGCFAADQVSTSLVTSPRTRASFQQITQSTK